MPLKVGEGKHYEGLREKGKCYCVCDTCLPTFIISENVAKVDDKQLKLPL